MATIVAVRHGSNTPADVHIDNDNTALAIGYNDVRPFIAAATLLIGDAVYLTAAGLVNKSATAGNYSAFIGIVVGGYSFEKENGLSFVSTLVGNTAALVNELVWVATGGVAYANAGAAITRGNPVGISGTSGRVDDIAAGNAIGIALEAASGTGVAVKIWIKSGPAGIIGFTPLAAVDLTAVAATGSTSTTPFGYTQSQADAIVTQLNLIIAALIANGIAV